VKSTGYRIASVFVVLLVAVPATLYASLSWQGDDFEQDKVGGQAEGWRGYGNKSATGDWQVVQDRSKCLVQTDAFIENARTVNAMSSGFAPECTLSVDIRVDKIGFNGAVEVMIGATEQGGCLYVGYGCVHGRCGFHIFDGFTDSMLAVGPMDAGLGRWYRLDIRVHERDVSLTVYTTGNPQTRLMSLAAVSSETPHGEIGLRTSHASARFDNVRARGRSGSGLRNIAIIVGIVLALAVITIVFLRVRRSMILH
jgi:hypothetical protein